MTAAEDARAALATVARGATFFAPYAASARLVEAQGPPGGAWLDALNGAVAQRPPVVLDTCADPLRFVPAGELPAGEAYEAFIARTARVPTRGNLHDLFNALVWLTFPETKRQLNALQAAQIAQHGVAAHRGAARDALTLFDENGAMWSAPPTLAHALSQRDWPALFITHRAVWRGAEPLLFGHALLEKLLQPRKAITAHLWPITPSDDAQRVIDEPHLPLPVLGVPGWWPANESPGFYDDAAVFRPVSIISR